MKININDESGTALIAVLKLDGTPAVEGVDYSLWNGEFHKNEKWSYTEGGVALKEGIVVLNQQSTHSSANNLKSAHIVRDGKIDRSPLIMRKFSETPGRPVDAYGYFGTAFEAILEAILAWGKADPARKGAVEKMEAGWASMAKFE